MGSGSEQEGKEFLHKIGLSKGEIVELLTVGFGIRTLVFVLRLGLTKE